MSNLGPNPIDLRSSDIEGISSGDGLAHRRQNTLRPSDSLEGHIDRNKNKIQKHARKHFLLQHILRAIEYDAEEIYDEVVAFPEYVGSKNALHEALGTLRPQAREDKRRSIAPNKSA